MKRVFKKMTALCMAFLLTMAVAAQGVSAQAASKNYTTGGDGRTSVTFDIKTGSSSSERKLTLTEQKGVYAYQNVFTGTSTTNTYGRFVVYVQEEGGSAKSYPCEYKKSLSITLKANTVYHVSIIPTTNQITYEQLFNKGKLWRANFLGYSCGVGYWKTYPTWVVTTKGVMTNVKSTSLSSETY